MRHSGFYTDGRTAARHEVSVQAGRQALHLYAASGDALDTWPYAGLYTLEEVYGNGPVRLRHRQRGDATLTLPTAELLAQVEAHGGRRLRGHPLLRPTLVVAVIAAVLVVAVVAGGLWGLPRLLAPLAHWVPASWEQALGERVLAQVTAQRPICERPAGQAALDALTARLTAPLSGEDALAYPLHVHVLDDPAVNAFAAPGGQVLVLRGLLEHAESPEAVAGVLAHEIAHAARRHPLQGLIRTAGTSALLGALLGDTATLDAAAAHFAQMLVLFSYSREDEAAADRLGVRLLNAADIRGDGLADFLQGLEARQGASVPALLSTHPLSAERAAMIRAEAHGTGPAMSDTQWQALRSICGGNA